MTLVGTQTETLAFVTASGVSSPAAETAIVSTDVINGGMPVGGLVERPVTIRVTINVTEGTGGTAWVTRCRQGVGTGGALVGAALTDTLGAGASEQTSYIFRDASGVPNSPAGTAYTITVAQTGATAAGTVNAIDVEVTQL